VIYISIPASLREGPRTTNILVKKRYLIIYILIITLSAQPSIFLFWFFWQSFEIKNMLFYFIFPSFFMIDILVLIVFSIIVAKLFLIIINWIHEPKEGIFNRNKNDRDYRYWSLRSLVKKWPIWLARQLNAPFLEKLIFKLMGVSLGKNCSLHEAWIDCEFVEIGNNVKIGQGSLIISNILIKNKLIIKKIVIGDNVIIGAHSIICPGTRIGENTIVESNTITNINQELEPNAIYRGMKAKKLEIMISNIKPEKLVSQVNNKKVNIGEDFLRAHTKELSVPFHLYIGSGILIIGGSFIVAGYLFYLYLFGFLDPFLFSRNFTLNLLFQPQIYLITFSLPPIIISLYLIHLFFAAFLTRLFYKIVKKKGPSQGIYDRNLDETSRILDYYHFGSFLMKYPILIVIRSPFPWLITWELNFIRSNKISKGSTIEETFIHSHVDLGENSYLGTYSHMTNHLVDGVYGQENLTFVGIKIGNNCVLNVMTGGLPGTEIGDGSTLLPGCTTIKYDKIGEKGVYSGFPARRLTEKEISTIFGGFSSGKKE